MKKRLLVVGAHPDDESFWCGGTLVRLAEQCVQIHVLSATSGQAGECGDPPVCRPDELGAVREAELRCACRTIGAEPPIILDYWDGKLAEVSDEEGMQQVLDVMIATKAQILLTWPPDGGSGHPDHIAVSRWATAAFEHSHAWGKEAPVALYYMVRTESVAALLQRKNPPGVPDDAVDVRVDIMPVWEKRMAALHCHRSQMNSSILRAPLELQQAVFGWETFCRGGQRPGSDWFDLLLQCP